MLDVFARMCFEVVVFGLCIVRKTAKALRNLVPTRGLRADELGSCSPLSAGESKGMGEIACECVREWEEMRSCPPHVVGREEKAGDLRQKVD